MHKVIVCFYLGDSALIKLPGCLTINVLIDIFLQSGKVGVFWVWHTPEKVHTRRNPYRNIRTCGVDKTMFYATLQWYHFWYIILNNALTDSILD